MKQDWPWVDDSWSWVLATWTFTMLFSFLLCMFEIMHNKNFQKGKKRKALQEKGNRAANALARIRTIYPNSCLFSICEYCAQKIQDTTYKCNAFEVKSMLLIKFFQYCLKYWHNIGKFGKFKQKESIWNHSKSELHFRRSIWASCNQQLKYFFNSLTMNYISN